MKLFLLSFVSLIVEYPMWISSKWSAIIFTVISTFMEALIITAIVAEITSKQLSCPAHKV